MHSIPPPAEPDVDLNHPMRYVAMNDPKDDAATRLVVSNNMAGDLHHATSQLADVAKSLSTQVNLSRLPKPEPSVFSGDPLTFLSWRADFQTLIESRGIPASGRIHFLKRYLSGEALACVQESFLFPSDAAYEEAKDLLLHRYGDTFTIAGAYRDKLLNWPKVGNWDATVLRKFAGFLRHCHTAMRGNCNLSILNDERENSRLLSKLPEWLISRWVQIVSSHRETYHRYPSFEEFVSFIAKEADIACDPVASLQAVRSEAVRSQNPEKPRSTTSHSERHSARMLGTAVERVKRASCVYCKKAHHIDKCQNFMKRDLEDRKKFASEQDLCFGCLSPGHRSRACQARIKCKTCSKHHPSALHGDLLKSRTPQPGQNPPAQQSAEDVPNQAVPLATTGCIGCNGGNKSSMIVPVWLSHTSPPGKEVLV